MSSRHKKQPELSEEERNAKNIKARRAFKAIVRVIIANLFWLGDIADTMGGNVLANIQKLTQRKQIKKSELTRKEKLILTKPNEKRTADDKRLLDRAIGGLRCFRKYPSHVKMQLAAVTYFLYIAPERVIVKQDHPPLAMYFLLAGEASVTVKKYDKILKEWIEEDHGVIGPGTMFGEVALLHDISRTATITTTEPCELLMIKKDDFDVVLKDTVWKAWERITKIINRYSYFKNWDSMTKRECSIICRTKTFSPNEVILGCNFGLSNYSYLITQGSCNIIEGLRVLTYSRNGIERYKLYVPSNDCSEHIHDKKETSNKSTKNYSATIETHFIELCELREGSIFNIGENLDNRHIISNSNTSCLLIPRYWLIKTNKGSIWNKIIQYLNKHIPSTEAIYQDWLKEKKLNTYKKELLKTLLKVNQNVNSMHNVPYSIRLKYINH